jgi:hypothetical protein
LRTPPPFLHSERGAEFGAGLTDQLKKSNMGTSDGVGTELRRIRG